MSTDSELAALLKSKKFGIECAYMELSQNAASNPKRYWGKGLIFQDENGALQFKLFTDKMENSSAIEYFQSLCVNRAGSIYKEHEMFNLRATEYDGTDWCAERLLPDAVWRVSGSASGDSLPCWSGNIGVLRKLSRPPPAFPKNSLSVYIFDDMDLPFTMMSTTELNSGALKSRLTSRDYVEFVAANCDFHIRKRNNTILIEVSSLGAVSIQFGSRIVEALRFVTARPLAWRVLRRVSDGEDVTYLTSSQRTSISTALEPPLTTNNPNVFGDFWQIFRKYLEYVVENTPTDDWSKCSVHLYHAIESGANSVDAWSTSLCIAVEGLAGLVPWSDDCSAEKARKELRKALEDKLTAMGISGTTLANRACGLINSLNTPRVQDRLAPLVASGHICEQHIATWKKLRHPGAHGSIPDLSVSSGPEVEKILSQVRTVSLLLYHVCFYLIGYEGAYTDYGTSGWPTKKYPLVP